MGKENEIIRPQSRLDANTVAASRAVDAQRAAVNAERQGMQTERSLQRKYRRAVRKDDFAAAADIAKTLALTGGTTVGPVIRKAEEERMVAGQRAIDRASLQEKIRNGGATTPLPGDPRAVEGEGGNPPPKVDAKGQEGADEVAGQAAKTANPNATAGAGRGKSIKKDGSETVGDKNEAADSIEAQGSAAPVIASSEGQVKKSDGKWRPNNRQNFIEDLRSSDLFKSGDQNAVERAVKRGEGLGISRDQVEAFSRGDDASLSAIAKEKANQLASKRAQEALSDELTKDNRLEKLKEEKDSVAKIKRASELLDSFSGISEPSPYGPTGNIPQSVFVRKDIQKPVTLGPSLPTSKEEVLAMKPMSKEAFAYWNVDPSSIAGKKTMNIVSSSYDGNKSDPRYPAMRIKAESLDEVGGLDYSKNFLQVNPEVARKNAIQQSMIKKALDRNVDISGFTTQEPRFHEAYLEAKRNRANIDFAIKEASRFESKIKQLIPS